MDEKATIERLEPEADLDALIEIERASFSTPWTPDMFRWELRNVGVSTTYVLRTADATIAAFCCVWTVMDELHINNVAVRPEWRRRGFAVALLTHAMDEAVRQGAARATLEVRRSNAAALELYERLGFQVAGVRRDYYTTPVEDALILWRSMSRPPEGEVPAEG